MTEKRPTCLMGDCSLPAVYFESSVLIWCKTHGEERMRCESNLTSLNGSCLYCGASQGEDCRKRKD